MPSKLALHNSIDSGVTIPAAGITGVLPVGVTGGSGLNAVPASPVTAIGMATGTIIQCKIDTGNASPISGAQSSYVTTNVIGSITPLLTTSKIYVHAVFCTGGFVTSGYGGSTTTNIYRSGSSVTDAYIDQDGYDMYFEAAPRTSNAQMTFRNPIAWYDIPGHSNITDAITYTIYVKGTNVQIHKDHGKWLVSMMEIQQ